MSVRFKPVTPPASAHVFPGAVVVGDVKIGEECSIWYNAVIRGDEAPIVIGEGSNVQDNAVLHVEEGHPLTVGKDVTVGHAAILHSCTVGDNTLIGMGAIVLDDAVIGKNCIVAAGALVTGRTVIPDGSMVMGSPAKVKRELTQEEIDHIAQNARVYRELKEGYR